MKEIQILESPLKSPEEQHIADMHSVINLLSVVSGVLFLLEIQVSTRKRELSDLANEIIEVTEAVKEKDNLRHALEQIKGSKTSVLSLVRKVLPEVSTAVEIDAAKEAYSNLVSIYEVASDRMEELEMRIDEPDKWVKISIPEMRNKFVKVFKAIEMNAKGAYRIQFDLNKKEDSDYFFDLRIESKRDDGQLNIPLRLVDILRDLTANSRKYTEPGGKILLSMIQDDESIQCRVEDTGRGIPEDELDKVVEFGYRASNVRNKATKGGGFGLSKAAWLVLSWGGNFSIASSQGEGSVVNISIPASCANTA